MSIPLIKCVDIIQRNREPGVGQWLYFMPCWILRHWTPMLSGPRLNLGGQAHLLLHCDTAGRLFKNSIEGAVYAANYAIRNRTLTTKWHKDCNTDGCRTQWMWTRSAEHKPFMCRDGSLLHVYHRDARGWTQEGEIQPKFTRTNTLCCVHTKSVQETLHSFFFIAFICFQHIKTLHYNW